MKRFIESLNISTSPVVNALIAVVAFIVIAKVVDMLIDKVFRRFARFTKSDLDNRIIDAIHRPLYYTIILVGVILAALDIGLSQEAAQYTTRALYSVICVIWGVTLIRISTFATDHAVNAIADVAGLSKDVKPLVSNVFKVAIVAFMLMAILSVWRIDITPVLASAGIAGLAIAIAAKDTLSNFFGGLSIFVDRPFTIGDYIVLDKGERGEVVAIGLRSTRIKTRDDMLISVPNALIANSKIINESAPVPNFRVRIPVSVSYGSDIKLVESALLGIASSNENVLPEPAPRVRFREFGDSGLLFELLCWAKEPALRGLTVHELNVTVYETFGKLGITIPYPQRDVHLHQG